MFASPFPAVMQARKDKQLGELNVSPYPAQCGNCAAWLRSVYLLSYACAPLSFGSACVRVGRRQC